MLQLEVRPSKVPSVSAIALGLICVPLGVGSIVTGLWRGPRVLPLALGLLLLAAFAFVVWLVRRGRLMSVKVFSVKGLERNDGRRLAWADLSRVVDQIRVDRAGRRTVWRTEIQFRGGESAWLIPSKISNYDEVDLFVRNLSCEHAEEMA